MKKSLFLIVFLLASCTFSYSQAYFSFGNGIFRPEDQIMQNLIARNSHVFDFAIGYKKGLIGSSFSVKVPTKDGLENYWSFNVNIYPTSYLIFDLGFSQTTVNDAYIFFDSEGLNVREFKNKSIGVSSAISIEKLIVNDLSVGLKLNHDFHGINIVVLDQYVRVGGTSFSGYAKLYFGK